eukprot:1525259-Ditylum_brightwellii.AAC.1
MLASCILTPSLNVCNPDFVNGMLIAKLEEYLNDGGKEEEEEEGKKEEGSAAAISVNEKNSIATNVAVTELAPKNNVDDSIEK